MSLDLLFTVSSIFATVIGLIALFFPAALTGAGSDTAALLMFRGFGGVFIALAVLDWMARSAGPSRARNGIVLGNTIGFLLAAIFTALAVLQGQPAWEWAVVVISALLAIGFFFGGMSSMQSAPSMPAKPSMPAPSPAPRAASKRPAKSPAKKATKKASRRR